MSRENPGLATFPSHGYPAPLPAASCDLLDRSPRPLPATFRAASPLRRVSLGCAAACLAIVCGIGRGEVTSFHVGNSLTWSAVSPGLPTVIEALGGQLSVGYHIRCGSPLENIVADPAVFCVPTVAPYGNWHNALTQHEWDYVTFQTHAGMVTSEIQAAIDLVATATAGGRNSHTRFFVYSAWPTRSDTQTYREARTQPLTSIAFNTDAYLGKLYSDVRLAHPTVDFGYVPVGEVLLRLDDVLRQSPLPGFTSAWDLYGDSLHLNAAGRYVAYTTMASVLTNHRAAEMEIASALVRDLDSAFVSLASAAIDHVVPQDPRVNVLAVPEPDLRLQVTAAILLGCLSCLGGRVRSNSLLTER
jgi:hypothetical protein